MIRSLKPIIAFHFYLYVPLLVSIWLLLVTNSTIYSNALEKNDMKFIYYHLDDWQQKDLLPSYIVHHHDELSSTSTATQQTKTHPRSASPPNKSHQNPSFASTSSSLIDKEEFIAQEHSAEQDHINDHRSTSNKQTEPMTDIIHQHSPYLLHSVSQQEYKSLTQDEITQKYLNRMQQHNSYSELPQRLKAHVANPYPLLSLTMIVKNEDAGLEETLMSTLGYINHYCLVDTGSTDSTINIITAFYLLLSQSAPTITYNLFMHEEFIDFSTTRNRALYLTGNHTEFILMMNGDDRLYGGNLMRSFLETRRALTALDEAIYIIPIDYGGLAQGRSERLVRTANHFVANWPFDAYSHWRFEGVTHEAYMNQEALQAGAQIIYTSGAFGIYHDISNDTPEKKEDRFHLDIKLLLQAITIAQNASKAEQKTVNEVDPNYARNVYYLAQSYYNLNDFTSAAQWYKLRVKLNYPRPTPKGEDNEKHRAYSILAHIAERQHESFDTVYKYWRASYDACPAAWSVFNLARIHRDNRELSKAKKYLDKAQQMVRKGSPIVCNGDDTAVSKGLPNLTASINQLLKAKSNSD